MSQPCCEYCDTGKPLRFTAERTLTHDAKALVYPEVTAEHPNGAPGPADTATVIVRFDAE